MKFLNTSLENLVKNLYSNDANDKYKYFNFMKKEYPHKYELLCQKGYYPYEWFDSSKKFDHIGLPSKHHFYSRLTREDIKEEDYKHAQKVDDELKCKTFKDYRLAYLHSDVLLLADVFENSRKNIDAIL
jgi:hypothetical protein